MHVYLSAVERVISYRVKTSQASSVYPSFFTYFLLYLFISLSISTTVCPLEEHSLSDFLSFFLRILPVFQTHQYPSSSLSLCSLNHFLYYPFISINLSLSFHCNLLLSFPLLSRSVKYYRFLFIHTYPPFPLLFFYYYFIFVTWKHKLQTFPLNLLSKHFFFFSSHK